MTESAARQAGVRVVAEMALLHDRVSVTVSSGECWLRIAVEPPRPGDAPWIARPASRGTAAELRALAQVLDGLEWADDSTVRATTAEVI